MRDRVIIEFGGGQRTSLLPAFGVMDQFEDMCGALTAHLLNLVQGTATLKTRATLVFLAMKAAAGEDGNSTSGMSVKNAMEAMWELGAADNDLMLLEQELIERLLYTPAQFQAKKEQREKDEKAQQMAMDMMGASPGFSGSPPPP